MKQYDKVENYVIVVKKQHLKFQNKGKQNAKKSPDGLVPFS